MTIDDSLANNNSDKHSSKVIVKTAPADHLLRNEVKVLKAFKDEDCFRQLIDEVPGSRLLVLQYLDGDLLRLCNAAGLSHGERRLVAKAILRALDALHSNDIIHTGGYVFA